MKTLNAVDGVAVNLIVTQYVSTLKLSNDKNNW